MDETEKTPGQQRRDDLLAEIECVKAQVAAYNGHWMNHKHTMSIFGVIVMALIFTSMLMPYLELILWVMCGGVIIFIAITMFMRQREAKRLNADMEAAEQAFKDYERSRRK